MEKITWFTKSIQGIGEIKLEAYKYGNSGKRNILLLGMHGNELTPYYLVSNLINKIRENEIFFRGMVKWLGFSQIGIEYVPNERYWGNTKYSIKKMILK